jgi:hypothetical protein
MDQHPVGAAFEPARHPRHTQVLRRMTEAQVIVRAAAKAKLRTRAKDGPEGAARHHRDC